MNIDTSSICTNTRNITTVTATEPVLHVTHVTTASLEEPEVVIPAVTTFHQGTVDNPFLFNGTKQELEQFFLTCIFVAGKNAAVQQRKVHEFVGYVCRDLGTMMVDTFGILSAMHHMLTEENAEASILGWLKEAKVGQYSRISSIIMNVTSKVAINKFDITTVTRAKLAAIRGIGYKTASFFKLYTDKNFTGVVLDTHLIKYMVEEQLIPKYQAPTTGDVYKNMEHLLLEHFKLKYPTRNIADLDFEIWSKYRVVHTSKQEDEEEAAIDPI